MKQKNVTYLLGNHDYNFYAFIKELGLNLNNFENDGMKWAYKFWQLDGGRSTTDGFLALSEQERKEVYDGKKSCVVKSLNNLEFVAL